VFKRRGEEGEVCEREKGEGEEEDEMETKR
jgi:hypothetical protein